MTACAASLNALGMFLQCCSKGHAVTYTHYSKRAQQIQVLADSRELLYLKLVSLCSASDGGFLLSILDVRRGDLLTAKEPLPARFMRTPGQSFLRTDPQER